MKKTELLSLSLSACERECDLTYRIGMDYMRAGTEVARGSHATAERFTRRAQSFAALFSCSQSFNEPAEAMQLLLDG